MIKYCYQNIRMFILLFSWFFYFFFSSNLHAQNCHLNDFSGCDSLYQKGQYKTLLDSFNLTDLASTTNARLSRFYYMSLGYFGLFRHERSVALQCYYLEQAKLYRYKFSRDVIAEYQNSSDFGLQSASTKIMFIKSLALQMDDHRGCIESPYSEARVDDMISQKVKEELDKYSQFKVSPSINPLLQLSGDIQNTMTITSNCINKNNSFSLELDGLTYTLKGVKRRLDQWQEPASGASLDSLDNIKKRNDTWRNELTAADANGLMVDLAAKEKNNQTATKLIKNYYDVTRYADLFNPARNSAYKNYKAKARVLVASAGADQSLKKLNLLVNQTSMNIRERDKPLFPYDVCANPATKKWYCD